MIYQQLHTLPHMHIVTHTYECVQLRQSEGLCMILRKNTITYHRELHTMINLMTMQLDFDFRFHRI